MKKLVLLAAVALSATMFSCGNGEAAKDGKDSVNDSTPDTTKVEQKTVVTTTPDSLIETTTTTTTQN